MAVITISKSGNKVTATISGSITTSTTKILNAYTKKHKLDVESTTINQTYGFTPSYK